MSSKSAFLKLLFEPQERTCFASNPKGTAVRSYPRPEDVFFCVNALHPTEDLKPELSYHSKSKPRRADHNVISYRNFLLEIDSMPIEDQIALIRARNLPVSSIVYSGGKSLHFIISLETPLKTAEEYRELTLRLHALIPEADSSTKNPSRFSRLPFSLRRDTNKNQTLLYLGERIKNSELLKLLPIVKIEKETFDQANPTLSSNRFLPVEILTACHEPDETMSRMGMDSRNGFFFWLGKRMSEMQFDLDTRRSLVEKAYLNLQSKQDFDFSEACLASRISV